MYQKRTLRRMRPLQRRLAVQCNDLERALRRLRKLVEEMGTVEDDALMWTAAQRWEEDSRRHVLRLSVGEAWPPCPDCGTAVEWRDGFFCPTCLKTLERPTPPEEANDG